MDPQEPDELGEYRLLEKLGQGGMATVYRGERVAQAGFKKRVALKRMLPQYRRHPALLERFAAEARTNARLNHPNLVNVVDFGIEPEPFLVMEFVEGVTLAEFLYNLSTKKQSLEIAAACFIAAEAAQGLDHAHRKRDDAGKPLGIVHRDVSPQNIMLSNEGAVKVSDFGLVKAADNVVQTSSGVPVGKISYMAPEQAGHTSLDARADVFSIGVVLWEMLSMRPLIPTHDIKQASQLLVSCDFAKPSVHNPKVSPALDDIVMSCLVKDPEGRTPSAQAVSLRLREILHELAPGYGREQLARLLAWLFPERGWEIVQPHETAAQPSASDPVTIPPPAAEEMRARASQPPRSSQPAGAAPVQPVSRKRMPTWVWVTAASGGLVLVLFLLALVAFVFFRLGEGEGQLEEDTPPPASEQVGDQASSSSAMPAEMRVAVDVPGARVYLGATLLGEAPVALRQNALNGHPLVVLASGYEPRLVPPAELLSAFERRELVMRARMQATLNPSLIVFVHNSRPAQVVSTAPTRRRRRIPILGEVPGVLRLREQGGRIPPFLFLIERGEVTRTLSTQPCQDRSRVCVLGQANETNL